MSSSSSLSPLSKSSFSSRSHPHHLGIPNHNDDHHLTAVPAPVLIAGAQEVLRVDLLLPADNRCHHQHCHNFIGVIVVINITTVQQQLACAPLETRTGISLQRSPAPSPPANYHRLFRQKTKDKRQKTKDKRQKTKDKKPFFSISRQKTKKLHIPFLGRLEDRAFMGSFGRAVCQVWNALWLKCWSIQSYSRPTLFLVPLIARYTIHFG